MLLGKMGLLNVQSKKRMRMGKSVGRNPYPAIYIPYVLHNIPSLKFLNMIAGIFAVQLVALAMN